MDLKQLTEEALKAAWLDALIRIEHEQANIGQFRQELASRINSPKEG